MDDEEILVQYDICKLVIVILLITFMDEYDLKGSNELDGINNVINRRSSCFKNVQENCSQEFTDVYKNLSRSPATKQLADTYFLLYTRKNPDEPEKLHKCGGKLPPNSNFNPNNRIVLITLSFLSEYCGLEVYSEWKDEILKKEDANVIVIDYNWELEDYDDVYPNLKLVAKQTIVVLNNIKAQFGVRKLNVMAIGISLGAELAGFIGKGCELQRIIGLDPAGPLLNDVPENERLSLNHAKLVDIWHCSAGALGVKINPGHVNYFINGGKRQEACFPQTIRSSVKGELFNEKHRPVGLEGIGACSHLQCTQYLKDSINSGDCQFIGVECSSYKKFKHGKCESCGSNGEKCSIMGYDLDKVIKEIPQTPQKLYVKTNFERPFCDNSHVLLNGYSNTYFSSLQRMPEIQSNKKSKNNPF